MFSYVRTSDYKVKFNIRIRTRNVKVNLVMNENNFEENEIK